MNSTLSTAQQNQTAIVKQAYAAFGRGDIPGVLELVDNNVEWHSGGGAKTPTSGRWHGREGVERFFATLGEHMIITFFEPRIFIEQNDRVAVIGRYAAKVKSTGRAMASDWAMVFTFRDGKIVHFTEFTDSAAENYAFGVQLA